MSSATAVKPLEMGLTLLTLRTQMSSPYATCKAPTTYTTILLRSLAALGGAFDVPQQKCPPDRPHGRGGSLGCVTGNLASNFPASYSLPSPVSAASTPDSSPELRSSRNVVYSQNAFYPTTPPHSSSTLDTDFAAGILGCSSATNFSLQSPPAPGASAPRFIPNGHGHQKASHSTFHGLNTPPPTPDSTPSTASSSSPGNGPRVGGSMSKISSRQRQDALDFLTTLFPRSGISALPHAKSVRITSAEMGVDPGNGFVFEGVVLDLPGRPKTLYVDGKGAENIKLRERYVCQLCLPYLCCGAWYI